MPQPAQLSKKRNCEVLHCWNPTKFVLLIQTRCNRPLVAAMFEEVQRSCKPYIIHTKEIIRVSIDLVILAWLQSWVDYAQHFRKLSYLLNLIISSIAFKVANLGTYIQTTMIYAFWFKRVSPLRRKQYGITNYILVLDKYRNHRGNLDFLIIWPGIFTDDKVLFFNFNPIRIHSMIIGRYLAIFSWVLWSEYKSSYTDSWPF